MSSSFFCCNKTDDNKNQNEEGENQNNLKAQAQKLLTQFLLFFVLYLSVATLFLRYSDGEYLFPYLSNKMSQVISSVMLFVCGLFFGGFLSTLMAQFYTLWLTRIAEFSAKTISRLNVVDSTIGSFMIGIIFQLHTLLVDAVFKTGNTSAIATTLTLYGPIGLAIILGLWIIRILPEANDTESCTESSESKPSPFLANQSTFFATTHLSSVIMDISQAFGYDPSVLSEQHDGSTSIDNV